MQNDFSDEPPVPQLSFDMPTQQSAPNNYYGLAALTTSNRNYDGGANQLGNYQETQSSGRSTLALPEENITTEQIVQSLQKPVKEVKNPKNQIPALDEGNFAEVFAIGMLLCMVYTFTQYAPIGKSWGVRISRLTPLMWIVGLPVLAFISLCHLYAVRIFVRIDSPNIFPFLDPYAYNIVYYWPFYQSIVYAVGYGLCMCAVLYGSYSVKRVFESSIARGLGSISFSLYLWHLPLLFLFADAVAPNLADYGFRHPVVYLALWCWTVVIILPVSLFLYRYVEKPGMSFGRWGEQTGMRVAMRPAEKR